MSRPGAETRAVPLAARVPLSSAPLPLAARALALAAPILLLLVSVLLALLPAGRARAAGLVIPVEPDLPPLALARHHLRVEIDRQAATTTIEEVFENHTTHRLEAEYVFPIPKGAALSAFALTVGGRRVEGELVGKARARSIYENTVRRSGDAGLLEHLGSDVFRATLFPVEPGRPLAVSLRFHAVLEAEGGLVHYVSPLRAHGGDGAPLRAPTVHGELRIDATIRSSVPIRSVYSPSHAVVVERPGASELEAVVAFSERGVAAAKDFHLYYSVSEEDVGFDLLTYRPHPGVPGHFLMLVAPRSRLQEERLVERDIVFVVDTSGSMEGGKMEEARGALRHAITRLNPGDRFALVRFSTSVYPFTDRFVPAGAGERAAALAWIDGLEARGGTDIAGALKAALSYPRDPARPSFVVFLTDGKPTLGDTVDPQEILARVESAAAAARADGAAGVRLFPFGIGYDVDTRLIDSLAAAAGGVSDYVRPDEDIGAKVAAFFNRTSRPLLTGVTLEVEGGAVRLADRHPEAVPDLHAGTQLVLAGRYEGEAEATVRLRGRVNEKSEVFEYAARFPGTAEGAPFVEAVWARRRVGYLLDAIRLRGETPELVDEVVRLSTEHGIQTPYTSYLALDDGRQVAAAGGAPGAPGAAALAAGGARGASRLGLLARESLEEGKAAARKVDDLAELYAFGGADRSRPEGETPLERRAGRAEDLRDGAARSQNAAAPLEKSLADGFYKRDGEAAVETARYLRRLKEAEGVSGAGWAGGAGDGRLVAPLRKAGSTRLVLHRGLWVDERFRAEDEVTAVRFGSPAYFALIAARPEVVEVLKASASLLLVTAPGKALLVAPSGAESLSEAEIAALFRPR